MMWTHKDNGNHCKRQERLSLLIGGIIDFVDRIYQQQISLLLFECKLLPNLFTKWLACGQ